MEAEGKARMERELLRYLGYRGQEIPAQLQDLIISCEQELLQAATPRAIWQEYPLHIRGEQLDMTCFQTRSEKLKKNLQGCEQVILFAATLGSRVDVLLQRYSRLQMSRAVVLQAASAAMLEEFCDEKNRLLKEEYQSRGWYLRPRFSPGYGDFPLECQRQIAAALELSKRVGITLTDSLLMAPSKSVTAVMGVSRKPGSCVVQGCEVCESLECPYRRDS